MRPKSAWRIPARGAKKTAPLFLLGRMFELGVLPIVGLPLLVTAHQTASSGIGELEAELLSQTAIFCLLADVFGLVAGVDGMAGLTGVAVFASYVGVVEVIISISEVGQYSGELDLDDIFIVTAVAQIVLARVVIS